MVFLELPKFKKDLKSLNNIQDKWIYFMKEVDNLEVEPKNYKKYKIFEKAFDLANKINLSKKELEILDKESMIIQDKRGMIDYALEKGYDE
jgi:predicted transposase/invertase (TIGR01784 family)